MNKKQIISLLLVTILIFSISSPIFADDDNQWEETTDYEMGEDHGKEIGAMIGRYYGHKHFLEGKKLDWREGENPWDKIPELKDFIEQYMVNEQYQQNYNNGFKEGFRKAFGGEYVKAYQEANMDTKVDIDIKSGLEDGQTAGELMGKKYGKEYFYDGLGNDWLDALSTNFEDSQIISKYNLNNETDDYRDGFLAGFRATFKKEFETTYHEINMDDATNSHDKGFNDGKKIGSKIGAEKGKEDYSKGNANDWYSALPKDEPIIKEYNLENETNGYRNGFIEGYKEAFRESYKEAYRKANMNNVLDGGAEQGEIDGAEFGDVYGIRKAYEDLKGDIFDVPVTGWEKHKMTPDEVIKHDEINEKYDIAQKGEDYQDAFYEAFIDALEKSYSEVIESKKEDDEDEEEILPEDEQGYNDGKEIGRLVGEIYGYEDYLDDRDNDWEDAIPSNRDIRDEYNLDDETSIYEDKFIEGFEEGFKDSYQKAYREKNIGRQKTSFDDGREHGEYFGKLTGENYGRRDYYSGDENSWEDAILDDDDIIDEYSLDNENKEYEKGFLVGFKKQFQESYTEVFRNTNVDTNKLTKENGIKHGKEIGTKMGESMAKIDYTKGDTNDWRNSIFTDEEIIEKYQLNRETEDYKKGFIVGFKDGFKESYIKTFQDTNINISKGIIEYSEVSMEGKNIKSSDEMVNIDIKPGTFYTKTYIGIEKSKGPSLYFNGKYAPASQVYNLSVKNQYNFIKIRQPIKLTFKYHGPDTGGIYKLVDGKWLYLYSEVEDGKISTEIEDVLFTEGTYAVFVDDNYTKLSDIRGHWGEKEMYTFTRRYYLSGYYDGTFRPETNVTRAEFVTILDRVSNWDNSQYYNSVTKFKDYMVFGGYKSSIAKAIARGYIKGYPDNTFRPNIPISYSEIEWLVERLPGNSGFDWKDIRDKMMYEKDYRSKSFDDKDKYITRAEVVYLLYTLQQQGAI
ncbi:S-layer homology domain-containing protein [Dethiothermospora halolimnae]|uniref:S-layer homology domain-containing protein n=1 Tax=Dethiothermospora halolimnae TaxID=3114390 RepID=UPI003CCBA629